MSRRHPRLINAAPRVLCWLWTVQMTVACGQPAHSLRGKSIPMHLTSVVCSPISKAALNAWTVRGPGFALQHVAVTTRRDESGAFVGYEIIRLSDTIADALPTLRQGDVIFGLQGKAIHTPEDLVAAWRLLRDADQVRVAIRRQGEPMELAIDVLDH
jgi:hypothetical protein